MDINSKSQALSLAISLATINNGNYEMKIDLNRADEIFKFICDRLPDLPVFAKSSLDDACKILTEKIAEIKVGE